MVRYTHMSSRQTRLVEVLCRRFSIMNTAKNIAHGLATAFVDGEFEVEQMVERARVLFGRRWRWIRPLAVRVTAFFGKHSHPRGTTVAKFILIDHGFKNAISQHNIKIADRLAPRPQMRPIAKAQHWDLPNLCTPGELADWLGVTYSELEWFADLKLLASKKTQDKLGHYNYRLLQKKRFGQIRLIEAPKPRLKKIQRHILENILDQIPAHGTCHGFRRGRSIKTFAEPHVGQSVVLKIDLQDFFPSIPMPQVHALFRTVGYPEKVADLLTGLCRTVTPQNIWNMKQGVVGDNKLQQASRTYSKPHLPQGAPTSPQLANLCAYWLDRRLAALAESASAKYTRYADDLAFSGDDDFARVVPRFLTHACATIMEEGYKVHFRKTRVMRRGVPQRLAGIIVNEHLSVPRRDRERLKAILTNCIRLGVDSQNRSDQVDFRNYLRGKISFVEMINSNQGRRLRELFEQIEWQNS